MKKPLASAVVFVCIGIVSSAFADTTIGNLDPVGLSTSSGHSYFGETFIAPAEPGLITGSHSVFNATGGTATGTMRVYSFSHDASNGTFGALIASRPISVPSGGPTPTPTTVTSTFNVPLVAGNEYILSIHFDTTSGNLGGYYGSNYYADGIMILAGQNDAAVSFANQDRAFQATFGAIPEPTTLALLVPALALRRTRNR